MTTKIKDIIACTELLNTHLHPVPGSIPTMYMYEPGWDDARIGAEVGDMSGARVRGIRTQLGRKLVPRETGFEKLVRLHNELAAACNRRDLQFVFEDPKRNTASAPTQQMGDNDFTRDE